MKPDPNLFTPVPVGAGTAAAAGQDDALGGPSLKINWVAPAGILAQNGEVSFDFDFPPGALKPGALKLPCYGGYKGTVKGTTVTIDGPELDRFAKDMITQIATLNPSMSLAANPLAAGIKSKKVTITPTVPSGVVAQAATTIDQLSVEFKPSNGCPTTAPKPTAEWTTASATLTVPFVPNKGMGIEPSADKNPDPATLKIKTEHLDTDLAKVERVDLALTLKSSDTQMNTIVLSIVGKETLKDGILSFSSKVLSDQLFKQFMTCFPSDRTKPASMTVTTTTVDLKDGAGMSLLPAKLTTTKPLEIKWIPPGKKN
jgi:hypothetical protein